MAAKKRKARNWMAGAVRRPGALRAKAKRAGMSTSAYAKKHAHDPGRTGKQARLAQTFAKFRRGSKKRSATRRRKRTRSR
jgi:hypothetical protein